MKLPNSYYNTISFFGSLIAGFSFLLIAVLFIISNFFDVGGSYIGLFIYLVLPVFLVIGLLMIPFGMYLKRKREKRTSKEDTRWKVIDLNNSRTRNAMIIFTVGTFIFIFFTAIGSYKAFHYTESNEFCGTLCHTVMSPEYTAYQGSSHAHVRCVECHVGEGADWYVRSKLSGMYQVYSVLANKYPRPIETPISNLRPARETCEKCHWPDKFYANRVKNIRSYLSDSANTVCNVTLKMKTASELSAKGHSEGIHWHINPDIQIEYVSRTMHRDTISWVKYTNIATGESTIYKDENDPLSDSLLANLEVRTMDCMDCHNRPSHLFNSPTNYIDDGFNKGEIPTDLPYIKHIALKVLNPPLMREDSTIVNTTDSALVFINEKITEYYKNEQPGIFSSKKDLIEKAIAGIQEEFSKNVFPEMNVYHTAYTNHIGHQESKGCFRCHSGTHVSEDGKTIRNDCNLCHTILAQGTDTTYNATSINKSLQFVHPPDQEILEDPSCSECHQNIWEIIGE